MTRRYETEFLPAALALQDTPPPALPRAILWTIIAAAVCGVAWACIGEIDVVATAQGRIVPSDRSKTVQAAETAVVKAIHVADGVRVQAGDVLIELDATTPAADVARIANEQLNARLQAAREQVFVAAIGTGRAPALPRIEAASKARQAAEQRLLDGQYAELAAKRARIDAEADRREAELRATNAVIAKLSLTAPIARKRADDLKKLVESSFVSQHGYLEREQAAIEQEGELATQHARAEEIRAALREAQEQRQALLAEARRAALDRLSEAERLVAVHTQELVKAEHRTRLTRLAAPVDGTVQQLAVHTVGGVVTPAQPLMIVVPFDHPLEVEAFIENKDIGFVDAGQDAEVKIETFPYTKYGMLRGTVLHVSRDAVQDEQRGLIYAARLRLERDNVRVGERDVMLAPGMAVTAEIRTGARRVIEFFLSPLLQYRHESLRER